MPGKKKILLNDFGCVGRLMLSGGDRLSYEGESTGGLSPCDMTFELKGIEYREGREEWGAEKGKKYLVEVLGRRTTLDGAKLWEG